LKERGHENAGHDCREAIAQRHSKEASEIGAEGTHYAAADHMKAPQQQSDAAGQIEKNHASHGLILHLGNLGNRARI
jgi:hypothetical protein